MKKIFLLTIIAALCLSKLTAQRISQQDISAIDNLFRPNLVIEKNKIASDTLSIVFKGNFYMVDPRIILPDEKDTYTCRVLINITDGVIFDRLDTGLSLVVNDNFYLKTEKAALIFEGALDKLHPITEPEDLEFKKHIKSGNDWYFIRGEFFDSKKGYKATIDNNGKITGIRYDLHLMEDK